MTGFQIPIYAEDGQPRGHFEVGAEVFGGRVLWRTLHQVVVAHEANQRQGTHQAKTRGQVRGSGKKPWRQKGTGRARAGCRRSPIWRGGGVAHPPRPRDYRRDLPRKVRQAALRSALWSKVKDGEIALFESLSFERPQTKRLAALLKTIEREQALVVYRGIDIENPGGWTTAVEDGQRLRDTRNLVLSIRNLPRAAACEQASLHAYEVLRYRHLVCTRAAFEALLARLDRGEQIVPLGTPAAAPTGEPGDG